MNIISMPKYQHIGLGNIMMQYMFAEKLRNILDIPYISDIRLQEWGVPCLPADGFSDGESINIHENIEMNFDFWRKLAEKQDGLNFQLNGFFQRLELFPDLNTARALFQTDIVPAYQFSTDELVINIRGGEILDGHVAWYPVLPVSFYQYLVEITGLRPVFMGQIDDNLYTRQLREAFPDARFLPSLGAVSDFTTLRSAHNICISVSTFSWLAAWLSEARQIFYPLAGFLSPALQRCYEQDIAPTNLVPLNDSRYRYIFMPLFYNEPIADLIKHHKSLDSTYKEVSASALAFIRQYAPFCRNPLPTPMPWVDRAWYLKTYPAAASEIAEGWWESPPHHYHGIGQRRGYMPCKPVGYRSDYDNIASEKETLQSSICDWSIGGTVADDACRLINGNTSQAIGCHTAREDRPWWQIDLGRPYEIECIKIFNRSDDAIIEQRLFPFSITCSIENASTMVVARSDGAVARSCVMLETGPVIDFIFTPLLQAQIIRITIEASERFLNLVQVKIFGVPLSENLLAVT